MKRLTEDHKITEFFGVNVFNDKVMKKYLDEETYLRLKEVIDNKGTELNRELADKVAQGMKEWATENGATHYTHWFQPLTGTTAEKHDSFLDFDSEQEPILSFSGKSLSKGEADASSFPSGGIRATFEARGYTVWDCSSPAFIKKSEGSNGVLCIPTAFCSYNGDVLDKKTPLLRSMQAINRQAKRMLKLLGKEVDNVYPNVGGEQEYFLIDRKDYLKRDDLKITGRTLFGAKPPKGQEKNDQYYASIKERVSRFMAELDEELWKLGIYAKTEHNEAAPSQHELAPIFSTANIATDQNQIIMEMMKKVAYKHDLACLLHEKPFKGVNGSGKHDNWSLTTSDGQNLLEPGKSPSENKQFLLFFLAVIGGVDEYANLVRMSAACPGNDQRLGGNEAPPTIISVFIGEMLEDILNSIEQGTTSGQRKKEYLKIGLSVLPELKKDYSDRNRTSPFAFTGNKFEFRMVGSSVTLATPNIVLNTITAEMLDRMCTEIEEGLANGESLDTLTSRIIIRNIKEHKKIIFNGNNYTKEWYDMAKERKLPILQNSVDCYDVMVDPKVVELYRKQGVFSLKELESRREIYLDNYIKTVRIEANTMLSMIKTQVMPVVLKYEGKLAERATFITKIDESAGEVHKEIIGKIDRNLKGLYEVSIDLEKAIEKAEKITDIKKQAIFFSNDINKLMDKAREYADTLEMLCDKKEWPFPNYADILFYE